MTKAQKDILIIREFTMRLLAGVLLGGAFGAFFNFSGRQLVFFVILGAGVSLLIGLNRFHAIREAELSVNKITKEQIQEEKVVEAHELPEASVEQLLQDPNRILTKTEARQWLDNFLTKQQGK